MKEQILKVFVCVFLLTLFPAGLLAAEIEVSAGTDAISTALAGASAGDTLILTTKDGEYSESATVTIDIPVLIMSSTGLDSMPVWKTDGAAHIALQADLSLSEIVLDGESTANSAIVNAASAANDLAVDACEFLNFVDEIVTTDDGGTISPFGAVTVIHSLFGNSGAGIVLSGDGSNAGASDLLVENSTFYDLTGNGVMLEGDGSVLATINYLTINNCTAEAVYLDNVGDASVVSNSVITNNGTGVKVATSPTDLEVTYSDLSGNTTDYDGCAAGTGVFSHDPWYEDADNGVFNWAWSQLTRASSDKDNLGDDRWGRYTDGPPRLALNVIGPGSISADPDKETYDAGEVVTITATPDGGAEFVRWLGDTLNASDQVVMDAHRYVTAQFAPAGSEIVDVNGSFSGNVDWSVVAMELNGSDVVCEEVVNGGVLLASAPDTLTVETDTSISLVNDDLYLAIISTKGFSHGHPHNTQVIDEVSGLGMDWEHVATQRASRNATILNIYKAQGSPSGDGMVSATLHNFPAGYCIALSVARYSGVAATDPIVDVVSHNTVGFPYTPVEITGYPRPHKRDIPDPSPDCDAYSVMLPVSSSSNPVVAIIAHRNVAHLAAWNGFSEIDQFAVESGGNTNSITIIDNTVPVKEFAIPAGVDFISKAVSSIPELEQLILAEDGGVYSESDVVTIDRDLTIRAAADLLNPPVWMTAGAAHIALEADLNLNGIVLDGESAANSAIVNAAAAPNNLVIDACEFQNFVGKTITTEDASDNIVSFDSVLVIHSIFGNSGAGIVLDGDHPQGEGQHTDNVPGAYFLSVEHSTFYNLAGEGVKLEAYIPPGDPVIANINYLTLNNCGDEAVYLKEVNEASVVSNSVITNNGVGVKVKYSPDDLEVTYSDLSGNATDFDNCSAGTGVFSHDPWYEDADNGVFNWAWSQLTRASSDKDNLGDDRWSRYTDGPPRLALNVIGPGTITATPDKEIYELGETVAITAAPEAGAEFVRWLGDTLNASSQIVMDAHRYVTAQFAPAGSEIVDINGSFAGNVDWSIVAMEFNGSDVVCEEVVNGGVLLASAPDTLTVETDTSLTLADDDLYLAIISTKGFSHGHPHNTQVIDEVSGLGMDWEYVATQRASRNATILNIYKAQGSPSGDGMVSATLHNFPAGYCIAFSVVRYSGVATTDPIVNIVSHNTVGFPYTPVEITGYPRPHKRDIPDPSPDCDSYSVMLPVASSSSPVAAFIAHRNVTHYAGEGFVERDQFAVESGGNTNSITIVDKNITPLTGIPEEPADLPQKFAVSQNYPNPFNPITSIKYELPRDAYVEITVHDILGRRIRTLVNRQQTAGYRTILWDGKDDTGISVSSGIYFYRIIANDFQKIMKMTLLK